MIKPILRQDIFKTNRNILSLIGELQNAMYQDDDFENEYEKLQYQTSFDVLNLQIESTEQFYSIIDFPHDNIDTYTSTLSKKLLHLLKKLHTKELYIVSGLKNNLTGAKRNKYKPLKDSVIRFEKLSGIENYDEAFELDLDDLPQCIETFFWLQRCDPSSPEFLYFVDKSDRFAFNICRYGNIHITEFEEELITTELLDKQGWEIITERCREKFSESTAIKGRKLNI